MNLRTELRKSLRQQRRELNHVQQIQHAKSLASHLCHSQLFRPAQHIALYLANDGEMDLQPVVQRIWAMGKQCYLPILSGGKDKQLWFAPYRRNSPLKLNHYGIPEPICHTKCWLNPQQLDLVLMPLVAFDDEGNRLGMGGGYYDRSFAFLNRSFGIKKPRLVGVAHELQHSQTLPYEKWDVPMNAVVTETGLQYFSTQN